MSDAPTQMHRDLWVTLMRRLQAEMRDRVTSSRWVIKMDTETPETNLEYEARAWAAEQLLEALRSIPTPAVASWDFPGSEG